MRCQRLLVDTKPEFEIPGVEPTRSLGELDWRAPMIHYQDQTNDLDEYNELFEQALRRRNLLVCVHELADLCDDQPNRTPKWVRAYIRKGNIRGNGLLGASQRPVGMPRVARTEAQHIVCFNPRVDEEDRKIMARMAERPLEQLDEALDRAHQLGERHSFVIFTKAERNLRVSGPLPDFVRERIIVRRAVDLPGRKEVSDGAQGGEEQQEQTVDPDRRGAPA